MDADRAQAQECAFEQATDWLILLQDNPDDPDLLRRFDAWLAASSLNITAWTATEHVAGAIRRTSPCFADRWRPRLDALRSKTPVSSLSTPRSARRRIRLWRAECTRFRRIRFALAATAIAACLAVLVAPSAMLYLRADYVTGTAEIRTIDLTDGSTIVLAPDSAVRVVYSDGERRVKLLSGEAFFSAVHDPDRPFRVGVEDLDTTDLGTAFDVRRGADGTSIAVRHGSVRVDYRTASPPVSETLRARQTLHIAWSGAILRGEEPADQIAAWRRRQLVAKDQPMRELVDRLRPYFAGAIVIANPALDRLPVTGVYNLADPVEALRGIARAHGGSVLRISPWVLVVSGG